nr:sporulation protein [Pseudoalteromonas piscicida]
MTMSFFKKALGAVGIGAAKVDTILETHHASLAKKFLERLKSSVAKLLKRSTK